MDTIHMPVDTKLRVEDTIKITGDRAKIIKKGDGYKIIDEGNITVVGLALNDKGGAFIDVDSLHWYFIKDLYRWPENVYNKKVKASGRCILYDQRVLMRKSPFRQGYGFMRTLQDAKWEVIE